MSEPSLANRSWSTSTWLSVASLGPGSFALVCTELLPIERWRTHGRPTAQWSRPKAGHSDDLGTGSR